MLFSLYSSNAIILGSISGFLFGLKNTYEYLPRILQIYGVQKATNISLLGLGFYTIGGSLSFLFSPIMIPIIFYSKPDIYKDFFQIKN
jgi:uncharacterized protein with PQ loop repeat